MVMRHHVCDFPHEYVIVISFFFDVKRKSTIIQLETNTRKIGIKQDIGMHTIVIKCILK